jgi:hypothetical protein
VAERRGMDRAVAASGVWIALLLIAAGVAVAATVRCTGGPCEGTEEGDDIYGSHGADTIRGHGGNDFVLARPGMDVVYGGSGEDRLYGGEQDDRIYAGEGDDYARGKEGDDEMYGGPGAEEFYGGTGSDTVRTGVVRGPDGAARPDGRPDYVNCGPGRDRVHYEKGVDRVENCEVRRALR